MNIPDFDSYLAYAADDYYLAGRAIAVALVHGGPPPAFLSPLLVRALTEGSQKIPVTVENLPESQLKHDLSQVTITRTRCKQGLSKACVS